MADTAYQRLEDRFRRIHALGDVAAVLHWDLATMMPRGGAASRGDQLALLKAMGHGMVTDPEMEDLLGAADADPDLDPWQRSNTREMRRAWTHATALTEAQVEALSRAVSACETKWRSARADSDFAAVLPELETVVALVRETAAAKSERLGLSPYDALLDEYEPEGPFDLITLFYIHMPAAERRTMLARAIRALAPGGRFFFVGHDRSDPSFQAHIDADLLTTPDEIASDLEGLEIERAEVVQHEAHGHGTAGTTVFLARRKS